LEAIEPILDKEKYKLKWTLTLHGKAENLYTQDLVLKRRLRLVKRKLTKVKEVGRKRKGLGWTYLHRLVKW